jgi:hypothetical protein
VRYLGPGILLLCGCAASPEKVAEVARTAPDSEVCEVYLTGAERYVTVIGAEIRRRNLDCRPYWEAMERREAVQNARAQRNAANAAATLQILRSMQPSQTPMTRPVGFLKREYVSGFNRVCIYDKLGSDYAVTISATSLCPLSQ